MVTSQYRDGHCYRRVYYVGVLSVAIGSLLRTLDRLHGHRRPGADKCGSSRTLIIIHDISLIIDCPEVLMGLHADGKIGDIEFYTLVYLFVFVFTLEIAVKMFAFGAHLYFMVCPTMTIP